MSTREHHVAGQPPDWTRRFHLFRRLTTGTKHRRAQAVRRPAPSLEDIKAGYFFAGAVTTLVVVGFCYFLLAPFAGWLVRVLS